MDDRDPRFPAPPSGEEEGAAAMTGATGSLTPDDADDEFVPAETREMSDAAAARDVTAATHRRRQAREADRPDEPRRRSADGRPLSELHGGYGSESGLAENDPAYREELHMPPRQKPAPGGSTRIGGDEVRSPEDEHL